MVRSTIYSRTYSTGSASRLFATKPPEDKTLSYKHLCDEFRNHAFLSNRQPTALVSASTRIVDTLKRAFNKNREDGEAATEIWIVFIQDPATTQAPATQVHAAKDLAVGCGLEEHLFTYEVVFEWFIPEKCIVHTVTLQTLLDRGLSIGHFSQSSTENVRRSIAMSFVRDRPVETGYSLGSFARKFGARAPVYWIAHQLWHDCVKIMDWDCDIMLKYAHGSIHYVDEQFFEDLEDGIETSIGEWWLGDADFNYECQVFDEERAELEDVMVTEREDFLIACHEDDSDDAERDDLWIRLWNELSQRQENKRVAIEAKAIKIGL